MSSLPHLTPESASEILDAARSGRVLVVGDVMLDRYLIGQVNRISPEAPVPVLHVNIRRRALGGAANVAAGVRALGAEARLVGVVGADAAAAAIEHLLRARGIDAADLVVDPDRPTTVKTRALARQQQMLRIDRETSRAVSESVEERLLERATRALGWAHALVLEDYDKGVLSPRLAEALLSEAARRGVVSVVDPKLRHFFAYRGASVFKPNARELAAALGLEDVPRDGARLREVAERLRCGCLLVTLGDAGMLLLESGAERPMRIPSEAREVYDVSGAGDTVSAVLAATLGAGTPLRDAATLANFAAGLGVSRLGARPVGRRELRAALAAPRPGAGAATSAGEGEDG